MAGATYMIGEQKIRPGVYARISNTGGAPQPIVSQGIAATIFQANWGPLGSEQILELEALENVQSNYGNTGNIATPEQVFKGGVRRNICYRVGTGGSRAIYSVKDSAAATVGTLSAKWIGTRGNSLKATIRTSLAITGFKELIIYEGTTQRAQFLFPAGATGNGEVENMKLAIASANQNWITFTKTADGTKLLADITQSALSGGADPTVDAAAYSAALTAIESKRWNGLAVDSESTSMWATIQAYIDRLRNEGKKVVTCFGEPTATAWATRIANAKSFNDCAVGYIANGFKTPDGVSVEGQLAAARVLGRIVASQITESLTHDVVTGAVDILDRLTNSEIEEAILSGAMCFTDNALGQIQIEYGINTLITPSKDQDAGWKKWRRVKTRDNILERCAAATDPLIGKVDNDKGGQQTIINVCQGILNRMRDSEGAILNGTCYVDGDNPPQGDSLWLKFAIDDKDSAEKVYFDFGFRFAAGA